jgi:phage tail-like protein
MVMVMESAGFSVAPVSSSASAAASTGGSAGLTDGGHAACRFYVEIGDGGKQIQAVFTELSGLSVEMQTMDYEEGGTNTFIHKLPGRLKVGNITLKHGLTKSNEFLKWCMRIERKNVTVVMYDVAGKPVVRWHFTKAFAVKWTGPNFTADSTAMAIESVEITHQGLTVE